MTAALPTSEGENHSLEWKRGWNAAVEAANALALSERAGQGDTVREAGIRARVEAAVAAPWHAESDANEVGGTEGFAIWGDKQIIVGTWYEDNGLYGGYGFTLLDEPTAEFIAHAREDIPYLLTEVTRLRMALEEANRR